MYKDGGSSEKNVCAACDALEIEHACSKKLHELQNRIWITLSRKPASSCQHSILKRLYIMESERASGFRKGTDLLDALQLARGGSRSSQVLKFSVNGYIQLLQADSSSRHSGDKQRGCMLLAWPSWNGNCRVCFVLLHQVGIEARQPTAAQHITAQSRRPCQRLAVDSLPVCTPVSSWSRHLASDDVPVIMSADTWRGLCVLSGTGQASASSRRGMQVWHHALAIASVTCCLSAGTVASCCSNPAP